MSPAAYDITSAMNLESATLRSPVEARPRAGLTAVRVVPPPDSTSSRLPRLLQRNLDFHGTDGKFSSHGWHPFPAKFPPQLPGLFIEELTDPGELVLDPMMGSGTALVEAARLGRRAAGRDIDPLALLITEAKLSPIPAVKAVEIGFAALESAKARVAAERRKLRKELGEFFDEPTKKFADYWFLPETQLELMALLGEIRKIRPPRTRRFFELAFSATIIAKSGGVSLARDLAHTRPHKVESKLPPSAFSIFLRRLGGMLGGDGPAPRTEFNLRRAGAADTGMPANSADLIVTSPPYANNAIDYMRAHKFALVWFGHKVGDLSHLRAQYLGHDSANGGERALPFLPPKCREIHAALSAKDAKKAAALSRYFAEMSGVIGEMHRVLKRDAAAVIVVGSSVLRGVDVETHNCLAAIGQAAGFELAGIGIRHLDRDRRMMPARWDKGAHTQIEKRMHDEFVIGLVKA